MSPLFSGIICQLYTHNVYSQALKSLFNRCPHAFDDWFPSTYSLIRCVSLSPKTPCPLALVQQRRAWKCSSKFNITDNPCYSFDNQKELIILYCTSYAKLGATAPNWTYFSRSIMICQSETDYIYSVQLRLLQISFLLIMLGNSSNWHRWLCIRHMHFSFKRSSPRWLLNLVIFALGIASTIAGYKSNTVPVTVIGAIAALGSLMWVLGLLHPSPKLISALDHRSSSVIPLSKMRGHSIELDSEFRRHRI